MAKLVAERRGDQPDAAASTPSSQRVPPPKGELDAPLQMLVHNIEHDDYVGRLGIGRIWRGKLEVGQTVALLAESGTAQPRRERALQLRGSRAASRSNVAQAGDIVAVAGIEDVQIGDTLAAVETPEALPRITVEEPTIKVRFVVNTSPFAGQGRQVGHVAPPARAPVQARPARTWRCASRTPRSRTRSWSSAAAS